MSDDCMALADIALAKSSPNSLIAYHAKQTINADAFNAAM